VHRRSVLLAGGNIVVCDDVTGQGVHKARLHWLAAPLRYTWEPADCRLLLETGAGPLAVQVVDGKGRPGHGEIVTGRESPPRGWVSRRYGERQPVASFSVEERRAVPIRFLTIIGPDRPRAERIDSEWNITTAAGRLTFRLTDSGSCPFEGISIA
jgi:hypothetical protein